MNKIFWASAVGLGLVAIGAPALANPHHFGQPWGTSRQQRLVYPYGSFAPFFPAMPSNRGWGVYVAPLQPQPVYGTVVPHSVTAYPYVNFNSQTGFSYGVTTFPGGAVPTVGGYITPVYGPGWVIYPNAPRYGY